jgi:hypothetical protein
VQQPEPGVQEVQATGEVLDEVVVDCPNHVPCNFVKGKPRSIISLLISEIQLSIMLYIYCYIKLYCYIYIYCYIKF